MKPVQISFDEELLSELDENKDVVRYGRSAVVRQAVREYLHRAAKRAIAEQYRQAYAGDRGLGEDSKSPPDEPPRCGPGLPSSDGDLREELERLANASSFVRFGVARAERLEPEATYLTRWLAEGRHGEMRWLERTEAVRADVRHEGMLPAAESVIVLVTPYARESERVGPAPGRIARYARGRDYHTVLRKRLRPLVRCLRKRGHEARASVDSLPVFERAWAERSGVGFVGKNCCLIVPGLGSHVFLSTVVTDAALSPDAPMAPRCGSCRLCLDACPTGAFVAARELDARRCISYQTIENKGPIPQPLRSSVGDWLFGCDACQDCCPYNQGRLPESGSTDPFAAKERWSRFDAAELLNVDEERFQQMTEASPLRRAGRVGLARNAATVLGNHGSRRHLPVLQRTMRSDPSPVVRDAAGWAVERIESRPTPSKSCGLSSDGSEAEKELVR